LELIFLKVVQDTRIANSNVKNNKERQIMDLTKFVELLEKHPTQIATVNGNGHPNISVVADVKVLGEDRILIAHNEMVKTVENIKEGRKQVCLTCFNPDWQGVRVYGEAEYFTEGGAYDKVIELFANEKTNPQGAIVVTASALNEMV
jgi:predicted pyridoxine 5'-phosphate oxidase superfamily flavin-nucleotide-binding protein